MDAQATRTRIDSRSTPRALPLTPLWRPVDIIRYWPVEPPIRVDRSIMSVALHDRFHAKQGRSGGAWRDPAGRALFLKRHHRLPWTARVLAVLAPTGPWSPAVREWYALAAVERAGIRVPRRLAVAQFVGPGIRLQSVLVLEELRGYAPAHEWLVQVRRQFPGPVADAVVGQTLEAIGTVAAILHVHRLFHKDLYLCHFFLEPAACRRGTITPRDLVLIDFHRLRRHRWFYLHWWVKDLAQLVYSIREARLPRSAEERFFAAYWRASAWPVTARRIVRTLVERKVRHYWRHNVRRGTLWQPKVA